MQPQPYPASILRVTSNKNETVKNFPKNKVLARQEFSNCSLWLLTKFGGNLRRLNWMATENSSTSAFDWFFFRRMCILNLVDLNWMATENYLKSALFSIFLFVSDLKRTNLDWTLNLYSIPWHDSCPLTWSCYVL